MEITVKAIKKNFREIIADKLDSAPTVVGDIYPDTTGYILKDKLGSFILTSYQENFDLDGIDDDTDIETYYKHYPLEKIVDEILATVKYDILIPENLKNFPKSEFIKYKKLKAVDIETANELKKLFKEKQQ